MKRNKELATPHLYMLRQKADPFQCLSLMKKPTAMKKGVMVAAATPERGCRPVVRASRATMLKHINLQSVERVGGEECATWSSGW